MMFGKKIKIECLAWVLSWLAFNKKHAVALNKNKKKVDRVPGPRTAAAETENETESGFRLPAPGLRLPGFRLP